MDKYQYDTGKEILTGAKSITRFIIKKWASEGKKQFTAKELDEYLKNLQGLNTPYKDNTGSNLHSMCVNSNSSKHYSNSKPDFLYLVDRGIFEMYDPIKHGDNVKQIESLLNDLAVINKKEKRRKLKKQLPKYKSLHAKDRGAFGMRYQHGVPNVLYQV
ncbi:DUF7669 domain-containing protein [Neisseria macacae]|uniref:DUF7669 domain-containing protein n=1 Tax=Neisseria macacae ATCC 33926 TaxID=997348 RepID=A0AA36XLP4_9NEIS|nr:hypothetical protein [Neisseria macacae]EGQ77451.1 hypothetical protein HMPREF9418_1011 [Neisseria macacae ATCC 33926]